MTVAERIRIRRETLGLTQDQLASKMGFKGKSSISKIESSENKVTLKTVEKAALALNCTPAFLMGWTEQPASSPIPPAEMAHLEKYRALDAEDQDTVDALTENLLAKSKYHTEEDSGQTGAA